MPRHCGPCRFAVIVPDECQLLGGRFEQLDTLSSEQCFDEGQGPLDGVGSGRILGLLTSRTELAETMGIRTMVLRATQDSLSCDATRRAFIRVSPRRRCSRRTTSISKLT